MPYSRADRCGVGPDRRAGRTLLLNAPSSVSRSSSRPRAAPVDRLMEPVMRAVLPFNRMARRAGVRPVAMAAGGGAGAGGGRRRRG